MQTSTGGSLLDYCCRTRLPTAITITTYYSVIITLLLSIVLYHCSRRGCCILCFSVVFHFSSLSSDRGWAQVPVASHVMLVMMIALGH